LHRDPEVEGYDSMEKEVFSSGIPTKPNTLKKKQL